MTLPIQNYALLSDEECDELIIAAKQKLGSRCIILGHHYQRDEVFKHADITGDSLKLSREAAQSAAEYIVFCGVHFMAEVADILSRPEQIAILPDMAAGCSKNAGNNWLKSLMSKTLSHQ
jgi:quinolinate synthase